MGLSVRLIGSAGTEFEGAGLAAWRDTSGDGRAVASQSDRARRPSLVPNAIGGKPVVHFDGKDDYLNLPYSVTGKDHLTIATVSRTWEYERGSENSDCDFDKDGVTDVGRELNCSGTDQDLVTWQEGGGRFQSTGIFYGVGQTEVTFRFGTGENYRHFKGVFVLEHPNEDNFVSSLAEMDGAARRFYLNGQIPKGALDYRDPSLFDLETSAQVDESGTSHLEWPVAIADTEGTAWLGRGRFEPETSFWAGELAEFLIYERVLDDAERAQLIQYFRCAYFGGM